MPKLRMEGIRLPTLVWLIQKQAKPCFMVDPTKDRAARLRSSDAQHLKSDGILDAKNRDVVAEQLRLF